MSRPIINAGLEGGAGLILTEGTGIPHPAALSSPNVPRFHGGDALDGWKHVLAAVHGAGGRIMPQLWHVGMMRKPGDAPNPDVLPVGPSGIFKPDAEALQPMTEAGDRRRDRRLCGSRSQREALGFPMASSCMGRMVI